MAVLGLPVDSVFKEHSALVKRADDFHRRDEADLARSMAQEVAPVDWHWLLEQSRSLVAKGALSG
jgi:hypothetical protein